MRVDATDKVDEVFKLIRSVLERRLKEKGTDSYASTHECLGILTEEYYELVDAVQSNDGEGFESEMIDVAVAAIWSICSKKADALDF
jgi:NTP pyrophosphatase (non-canonical NTP hydrolase)